LPCVEHDKAEATGRLLVLIQPHDDALYKTTFREHLIDLLLPGEEGKVPNLQEQSMKAV
jgi:hypothetical protein